MTLAGTINLISLNSSAQATLAQSTNSSATVEHDFSALLSELLGTSMQETSAAADAMIPAPSPAPTPAQPAEHMPAQNSAVPAELPDAAQKLFDLARLLPQLHTAERGAPVSRKQNNTDPILAAVIKAVHGVTGSPRSSDPAVVAQAVNRPDIARDQASEVLREVKKIEFTVQHEPAEPVRVEPQPISLKQPVITTDPLANIRQTQLLPRVMPVEKTALESKTQDHKSQSAAQPEDTTTAPVAVAFAIPAAAAPVEQARAAHIVDIPQLPKLQVVRTVAMEVGDADSHVIVRIEDRGGTMNLHFGAGSDTLHHGLESSVDSLVNALRQEKIQVCNVDVSRKSPIEKVRRTKESH